MDFFISDELDQIDLGESYWVKIKKRMSYGAQQALMAHFVKIRQGAKDLEVNELDMAGGNIALLTINIKEWNLPGKDGKVMPINKDSICRLSPDIAEKIIAEIGDRNPAPKA